MCVCVSARLLEELFHTQWWWWWWWSYGRVRMWCEFDVKLNNFRMMQPFCCIHRKRMWQWFHAAEYILQHWPQYTSNYIPSTEPACHNVQTNDKGTLWHRAEKCLECCFGLGSEMHQLSTFRVKIMRPWIYPDFFLTFFEILLFFYFFFVMLLLPSSGGSWGLHAAGFSVLVLKRFLP